MTASALPCIACGRELRNIEDDAENQPYEGTAFTSGGHYGSTAFDPMDGSFIEINVCDKCLIEKRGTAVYWSRKMKPVLCHVPWSNMPHLVGWCPTPDRPYTNWTGDESSLGNEKGEDVLYVEAEEVGDPEGLMPEVEWNDLAVQDIRAELEAWNADQNGG